MTPLERRRRRTRKAVIGALYAADISGTDAETALAAPMPPAENAMVDAGADDFGLELIVGVTEHAEELDSWISQAAQHWTIERMPPIDRAILRMALYELLWLDDIPPGATINEAVELAKCYSTTDSSRFVNGLLGRLAERAEALPRS